MLKTYTQSQMLTYWKRHLGLKASSAVRDEADMTELDLKLLDDIDAWYEDLLCEAPPEKLPVADVADTAPVRYISDNAAEILFPANGVRLVDVKMKEWQCAEAETFSAYSDVARLQRNRLTRATIDEPVIIRRPGRIEVHGLETPSLPEIKEDTYFSHIAALITPTVSSLRMVVHPPEGTYVLDSTLLRHARLYIH